MTPFPVNRPISIPANSISMHMAPPHFIFLNPIPALPINSNALHRIFRSFQPDPFHYTHFNPLCPTTPHFASLHPNISLSINSIFHYYNQFKFFSQFHHFQSTNTISIYPIPSLPNNSISHHSIPSLSTNSIPQHPYHTLYETTPRSISLHRSLPMSHHCLRNASPSNRQERQRRR